MYWPSSFRWTEKRDILFWLPGTGKTKCADTSQTRLRFLYICSTQKLGSLSISFSRLCVYSTTVFSFGRSKQAMAVGLAIASEGGQYNGKITRFVVLSCMVAATGGLIFGYDIGVSGPFLLTPSSLLYFH